MSGYLIFSGKALARNSAALTRLLKDVYTGVRFDEHDRIREIVAQARARREQAVTGSGHALAMGAAAQGLSAGAWLTFRLGGLEGIRGTKALDCSLTKQTSDKRLDETSRCVVEASKQTLLIVWPEEFSGYMVK